MPSGVMKFDRNGRGWVLVCGVWFMTGFVDTSAKDNGGSND
jgi:hypothetical protein